MARPPTVTVRTLLEKHHAVMLDAYGVLVDDQGAIPGAAALIEKLEEERRPWLVLTNDASRLPTTNAQRLQQFGLAVRPEHIFSPGLLLPDWFRSYGLHDAATVVLGTGDSRAYAELAGARVIEPHHEAHLDALVLCDEAGYPLLETLQTVLDMLLRAIARGTTPRVALANPDLIYPRKGGRVGLTAGSLALVLEHAVAHATGNKLSIDALGKPSATIFAAACERLGSKDAVLIGDQLSTDIKGAQQFGIAGALAGTGVTPLDRSFPPDAMPTYLLPTLAW